MRPILVALLLWLSAAPHAAALELVDRCTWNCEFMRSLTLHGLYDLNDLDQIPTLTIESYEGSRAAPQALVDGDTLGNLVFRGRAANSYREGARITADVDGVPGPNDIPGRIRFITSLLERWMIRSNGHLQSFTDNTLDIGAAGANRPRTIYAGTSVVTGTLALSGAASTSMACLAGYTRQGLNYCRNDADDFMAGWADATACTLRAPYDVLPTSAYAADVSIRWYALAGGAIAPRSNNVGFFADAACANKQNSSVYQAYEHAAVTAGTALAYSEINLVRVPLLNDGGVMKLVTTQANAGGNGNAEIQFYAIIGYYE